MAVRRSARPKPERRGSARSRALLHRSAKEKPSGADIGTPVCAGSFRPGRFQSPIAICRVHAAASKRLRRGVFAAVFNLRFEQTTQPLPRRAQCAQGHAVLARRANARIFQRPSAPPYALRAEGEQKTTSCPCSDRPIRSSRGGRTPTNASARAFKRCISPPRHRTVPT